MYISKLLWNIITIEINYFNFYFIYSCDAKTEHSAAIIWVIFHHSSKMNFFGASKICDVFL